MATPTKPNTQSLSPDQLANQLFDAAFIQYRSDPREAGRQVVGFLTKALVYAISSMKDDPVVFLTETLIIMVSSSINDEAARKELLKHIGDTIANAPPLPPLPQAKAPPVK